MNHKLWLAGIGFVVLILGVAGAAWAMSEEPETSLELAEPLGMRVVRGVVISSEEGQVSLELANGQVLTMLLQENTHQWVPGEPPTTTIQLEGGDPIVAFGRTVPAETSEQSLSARLILAASEQDFPKLLIRGRVAAVTKQTVVVSTGRGERAVTITPRSRLWTTGGRLDSLQAVRRRDQVIAFGQANEWGQWVAGFVLVIPPETSAGRLLRSRVFAVDALAGTITVEMRTGTEVLIVTDEGTRYRFIGEQSAYSGGPTLADITKGDQLVARGRWGDQAPDTFVASEIGLVAEPNDLEGTPPDV
jgi:hypothetical protein